MRTVVKILQYNRVEDAIFKQFCFSESLKENRKLYQYFLTV